MPIFDIQCRVCGKERLDVLLPADAAIPACPSCGGPSEKVWHHSPASRTFHEGWYEHVADTPQYFSSREKLKSFVKENGMYMDYVDGH